MIVLDTHIWLWFVFDDPRLNPTLKSRIEAQPADVLVPTICLWEATMLAQKGRIGIDMTDPLLTLRSYVQLPGFQEAPLTGEIAVLSRTLQFGHADPADRFIAATAYSLGAELATEDKNLLDLAWLRCAK